MGDPKEGNKQTQVDKSPLTARKVYFLEGFLYLHKLASLVIHESIYLIILLLLLYMLYVIMQSCILDCAFARSVRVNFERERGSDVNLTKLPSHLQITTQELQDDTSHLKSSDLNQIKRLQINAHNQHLLLVIQLRDFHPYPTSPARVS